MATIGHEVGIDRVSHRFGDYVAVDDVSLSVGGGGLVALLGPSGCGKSTLLRIIAGFIAQTSGRILFDGAPVDHLPANKRGVGIVFQNYALFPHMTVRENVAYGLQAQKWPRADIAPRVEEMLKRVHMAQFGDRYPKQLSGGQQQRVALARCLATDPKLLLLDEPFAALDKNLRFDMQIEVKRLQHEYGITAIMVTHDQEEALSMSDRIAVMSKGKLEQVASPTEIYDRPATLFVNQFVGSTNLLRGELLGVDSGGALVRLGDGTMLRAADAKTLSPGAKVVVAIRPEALALGDTPADGARQGRIKTVMPLGPQVAYDIETADGGALTAVVSRTGAAGLRATDSIVHVTPVSPASCNLFAID